MTTNRLRALVTGGNGHLAINILQTLEQKSFDLVTTVRKPYDFSRFGINNIEQRILNLGRRDEANIATRDIDVIFHTASPMSVLAQNEKEEIWDPIYEGTKQVFEEGYKNGVRHFVYTSSCSYLGLRVDHDHKFFNENSRNEKIHLLLNQAKAESTKWVEAFAKEKNITLNIIYLPLLIGPNFYKFNPGLLVFKNLALKKWSLFPYMEFCFIDARDAALIHYQAYEKSFREKTTGDCYIAAGENINSLQFKKIIENLDLGLQLKVIKLPKILWQGLAVIDTVLYFSMNKAPTMTLESVEDFYDLNQVLDNSKLISKLNFTPRNVEITLLDTLTWAKKIVALQS